MYTLPSFSRGRFDDFIAEFDRLTQASYAGSATVPVSVWSGDDTVAVTVEVPGVAKDDLGIEVTADALTISGERKPADVPTDGSLLGRERRSGRFARTITLPWRVDPDKVEARLANGVLTVAVRRAESDKPRKIAVAA